MEKFIEAHGLLYFSWICAARELTIENGRIVFQDLFALGCMLSRQFSIIFVAWETPAKDEVVDVFGRVVYGDVTDYI